MATGPARLVSVDRRGHRRERPIDGKRAKRLGDRFWETFSPTSERPESPLGLRVVLAIFGMVVCGALAVVAFLIGLAFLGVVMAVLAVVALADLIVVIRRLRQRHTPVSSGVPASVRGDGPRHPAGQALTVQVRPLSVKAVGSGFRPEWAPLKPRLSVAPGAIWAFQTTLRAVTCRPDCDHVALCPEVTR